MKRWQKIAYTVGCFITILGSASSAKAAYCPTFFEIPLTKARLNQIAFSRGIPFTKIGDAFDEFARSTIDPNQAIPKNTKRFTSDLRNFLTNGQFKNVEPDGVLPLVVKRLGQNDVEYENSVFYESKALKEETVIGLNYPDPPSNEDPEVGKFQILGFLDALNNSPSALVGDGVPALVFLTTSGVIIGGDVIDEGFFNNTAVWQSIACEELLFGGYLQMSGADILDPEVYLESFLLQGLIPFPIGPGKPGNISMPSTTAESKQQSIALANLSRQQSNRTKSSHHVLKWGVPLSSAFVKETKMPDLVSAQAYEQGMSKARARHYREALEDFNQAISANPDFPKAYVARGHVQRVLRNYEAAYKDFEQAASIYRNRGDLYDASLLQKAIEDTRKMLIQQ